MATHKFDRVYIEITNVCNFQCTFCPEVKRSKNRMSLVEFKSVVHQVRPFTKEITLHLMGEPLSHPEFVQIVQHCNDILMPIQLTTNGTLLSGPGRIGALLLPTVRQVNFSVQSLFDNWPPPKALKTLEQILDYCKRSLQERPEQYLNLRLWNVGAAEDSAEWKLVADLLKQHFDLSPEINFDLRRGRKSIPVTGRLYLHFDSRFEWPSLDHPIIRQAGFCYGMKSHIGILADGTVVPCCLDKEAAIPLGTILGERPENLSAILDSSRAQTLLKGFERFEVQEELCKRCTFINRFDGRVPRDTLELK